MVILLQLNEIRIIKMKILHQEIKLTDYLYGTDGQRAVKRSIFLGTERIVTKQCSKDAREGFAEAGTQSEADQQYYYHADHLGSVSAITDSDGDVYERLEYTPYGEVWIDLQYGTTAFDFDTPYRFTGKELDEETGLYYYGARYLDPKYSVWKSADPALGDYLPVAPVNDDAKKHNQSLPGNGGVFNVVNLNLYHYAGNNPVRSNDPTGESDVSQLLPTSRNMYIAAAAATQVDSPAIGPGDVAGAVIAIGATAVLTYAGLKAVFGWISFSISNTRTKTENGNILVSHYTSKEAADEIMSSGVIEPGKWEAYVFAMKEPATAKEAENAGANSTEVKITFEVNANEVIKDKGTSQKKTVQFTIPGPIYIENRNPVVTEN